MPANNGFDHDILILGGGLVGSSLACALQGRGWRVAQVEASAPQAGAPGFDERKLALALASLNALAVLDVLPRLATPPTPIERIHVSRAGDFGSVRLAAADHGRAQFGGVVLARELGQALESRLADSADLVRYRPARVISVEPDADGPAVTLSQDGETRRLRTRLLVAADGSHSLARAAWGIDTEDHDYGQTLVVCSIATDRSPDGTAYERFTDEGPVALLPMAGGHYGAICGVRHEHADAVLALDEAGYADYFQQRFGWRAGRIIRSGQRSAYPIARRVASRLTAPRGVVMGNAAQTLHPIGAQGFNLGLRDALTLAEVLAGDDPGSPALLAAYAEARREDRERTLAFSDGLARITSNDAFPLHVLRSLGLLALGRLPGLADPLVAGAMGFRGRVPTLSRSRP
ncbi:2-octaprenyl-6-methoxyphenyl hydroxylase [Arenimonas alkanexedens]